MKIRNTIVSSKALALVNCLNNFVDDCKKKKKCYLLVARKRLFIA